MNTSAARMLILAVFSGLSMNLILQLGLGLMGIAQGKTGGRLRFFAGLGLLFTAVMILWLIFSFIRMLLPLGLYEYVLVFPVSFMTYSLFNYLWQNFHSGKIALFGDTLSGGTLVSAALFITLNVAGGILEAAVLSLGFCLGLAFTTAVVGEIRRRSEMEAVPGILRGGPLALISMGLLSLVFSSATLMLFGILGAK
ncbi:MAG: hypothetical protein FWH38_07640 [Treponema sp.]|nr:hypothetical protein [Treponema sp.]